MCYNSSAVLPRGRTEGRSAFAYIRPPHCIDGFTKTPLQASVFARGKIAGGPVGGRTIHSSNGMDYGRVRKNTLCASALSAKKGRAAAVWNGVKASRAPQDIGVPADGIGFPAFPKDDEPKRKRTDFSQPASTGGNG